MTLRRFAPRLLQPSTAPTLCLTHGRTASYPLQHQYNTLQRSTTLYSLQLYKHQLCSSTVYNLYNIPLAHHNLWHWRSHAHCHRGDDGRAHVRITKTIGLSRHDSGQKALGVSFFPRMPRSIRLAGPSGLPLHELDYRNLGFLLQRNSARHCCIGSSGWSDGWLLRNPRMLEVDFGVVRAIRRQNLVQEGVGGLGTQRSVESDPPSVTQFV